VDVVRLEEIYSLNSNATINIVTAYLLIYASTGPKCSSSQWSPIRMIDIGTDQQYSSFLIYSAEGEWKLLYEQIAGILIDSFIAVQPSTYYELIELTKDITYPLVLMTIQNPYYELMLTIETAPYQPGLSPTLLYAVLGNSPPIKASSPFSTQSPSSSSSAGAASARMCASGTSDSGHTPIPSMIAASLPFPPASKPPSSCPIRSPVLLRGMKGRGRDRLATFTACVRRAAPVPNKSGGRGRRLSSSSHADPPLPDNIEFFSHINITNQSSSGLTGGLKTNL
jgi:hypothetical protein